MTSTIIVNVIAPVIGLLGGAFLLHIWSKPKAPPPAEREVGTND